MGITMCERCKKEVAVVISDKKALCLRCFKEVIGK